MNEMDEMNELETQLRAWPLRRPSARVKRQLFAGHEGIAEARAVPTFRLSWLAPATIACLLMCVLANQRNGASFAGSVGSAPLAAVILSNQSAAAYLPGSFDQQHNNLAAATFESTNGSGLTSSISSLPPSGGWIKR